MKINEIILDKIIVIPYKNVVARSPTRSLIYKKLNAIINVICDTIQDRINETSL